MAKATSAKMKFTDRIATWWGFRFFLNSGRPLELIGKCLLLIAIAYGYPYLCGLIFEKWLHMEHLLAVLLFIAITVLLIYAVFACVIVLAIIRFIQRKKRV